MEERNLKMDRMCGLNDEDYDGIYHSAAGGRGDKSRGLKGALSGSLATNSLND